MSHLETYLQRVSQNTGKAVADSIRETVNELVPEHIENFDYRSHRSGLLLGNVQSGKTGQMLGVLSAAADLDFEIFIVLTTDNIQLQQQTLQRTFRFLDTVCICGENDEMRFLANDMRKPVVVVLKKNSRVLETWQGILESSGFLTGRPIFVIDDESDNASLNTKINKDEQSTINKRITEIRGLSNSSFYLQTTATPQSLFLQTEETGFKPEFVYYFSPGEGYLGGDFFYSDPQSYVIKLTPENELDDLRDTSGYIPPGMLDAIMSFFISAAHTIEEIGKQSCNFLIHPSVSISDHEAVATHIGSVLNDALIGISDDDFKDLLHEAWYDLQETQPDLLNFDKCYEFTKDYLEQGKITPYVMNSKSKADYDFENGVNIIVGGNSLGRGVTFPNLQTTYYCRKSQSPQADTFWQHCRAFGYDREQGLIRLFLPPSLLKLFVELNEANNAMINHLKEHGAEGLKLTYPRNIRPTRRNVVKRDELEIISGGTNHFPFTPTSANLNEIDKLLQDYSGDEYNVANIDLILELISLCQSNQDHDWPSDTYKNCILSLEEQYLKDPVLIVRRNRDISKNTGTLLSPNDRALGNRFNKRVVLTMYRVNGQIEKGWDGQPLWIPNIKFPSDKFFYSMTG